MARFRGRRRTGTGLGRRTGRGRRRGNAPHARPRQGGRERRAAAAQDRQPRPCRKGGTGGGREPAVQAMTKSEKGTVDEPGTNVPQKAELNRVILDTGRTAVKMMIACKAANVVKVPAQCTSRTCHECGAAGKRSRRTREDFACTVPWRSSRGLATFSDPGRSGPPRQWRRSRCCPRCQETRSTGIDCLEAQQVASPPAVHASHVAVRHATLASCWRSAPLPGGSRTRWITTKGSRSSCPPFQGLGLAQRDFVLSATCGGECRYAGVVEGRRNFDQSGLDQVHAREFPRRRRPRSQHLPVALNLLAFPAKAGPDRHPSRGQTWPTVIPSMKCPRAP